MDHGADRTTLATLFGDLDDVARLQSAHVAAALQHVATLAMALSARLLTLDTPRPAAGTRVDDRLLDVKEAAKRLGMSATRLYREASRLPFTVKNGRSVRFSSIGIDSFIRKRQGIV